MRILPNHLWGERVANLLVLNKSGYELERKESAPAAKEICISIDAILSLRAVTAQLDNSKEWDMSRDVRWAPRRKQS